MGLFDGARAQLHGQKAIKTHVAANDLANSGKIGAAAEKYREAKRLYEEALAIGPQKPHICQAYAVLLTRLGDFDGAMARMQQIRRMKDLTENDWFELRLSYSVCLWRTGKLEEAIAAAKRAMQQKTCAAIYNTLGMYLVEQADRTGDFAEIEAFNRESMDYDDEDAGILDNVGAMYEAMARHDADPDARAAHRRQAVDAYAKAHAIRPRQITTAYHLARLYHEDGADDKARAVLEDAKDLYYSAACPVTEAMIEGLKGEVG